jgi:hypothetical protein
MGNVRVRDLEEKGGGDGIEHHGRRQTLFIIYRPPGIVFCGRIVRRVGIVGVRLRSTLHYVTVHVVGVNVAGIWRLWVVGRIWIIVIGRMWMFATAGGAFRRLDWALVLLCLGTLLHVGCFCG